MSERDEPSDHALARRVGTRERTETIEAAFWRFHNAHPAVYARIVELAREWRAKGGRVWSIGGAFEVMRWEQQTGRSMFDPAEAYKLNNNYRSRYAREVMTNEPDLAGVFVLRVLEGDR